MFFFVFGFFVKMWIFFSPCHRQAKIASVATAGGAAVATAVATVAAATAAADEFLINYCH